MALRVLSLPHFGHSAIVFAFKGVVLVSANLRTISSYRSISFGPFALDATWKDFHTFCRRCSALLIGLPPVAQAEAQERLSVTEARSCFDDNLACSFDRDLSDQN
jgi:hypothetical protein